MDDLVFAPAHELASRIQRREVSAVEMLEAHLGQIARHNSTLNAIVTLDEEGARRRAQEADAALAHGEVWGPLHGVPFTVKDAIDTAGLRTTAGFPDLRDRVPEVDAPVVARLRAAGAILLGKTNMPVGGLDVQTDNPIFGRTNNPWDLGRTPGGSTGGGGAALAAGMTSLEIGCDMAGSIRIPAHFCGVVGLKPTQHRVPFTGYIPPRPGQFRSLRQLAAIGPLARSVADLDLALRLIAGPDGCEWEVPPVPLGLAPDRPLGTLRLAWAVNFAGVAVTADTRTVLAHLAGELARRGAHVERCIPEGIDFESAVQTYRGIVQAEMSTAISPEQEVTVAAQRGWIPGMTVRRYVELLVERDAISARLEAFFHEWDALICPVTAGPAFPHCAPGTPIAVDGQDVPYMDAAITYTRLANLTGHPAVVVPLARSAEGLPIGVQLVGRRWGEVELLAIARRLEEVIGPFQRPPGY